MLISFEAVLEVTQIGELSEYLKSNSCPFLHLHHYLADMLPWYDFQIFHTMPYLELDLLIFKHASAQRATKDSFGTIFPRGYHNQFTNYIPSTTCMG